MLFRSPAPRMVPDIPPVPEPVSMGNNTTPVVQVNNQTRMIGGNKEKLVATSTPKQRNVDLDRYMVGSTVAV